MCFLLLSGSYLVSEITGCSPYGRHRSHLHLGISSPGHGGCGMVSCGWCSGDTAQATQMPASLESVGSTIKKVIELQHPSVILVLTVILKFRENCLPQHENQSLLAFLARIMYENNGSKEYFSNDVIMKDRVLLVLRYVKNKC